MNEKERQEFFFREVDAIYEEINNSINQLILSRWFLQKAMEVIKGAEPDYNSFVNIIKRIK